MLRSFPYGDAGLFEALVTSSNSVAGWSAVAVGGTQAAPTLTAVSPSHGPVGTAIQVSGSGFIDLDESVIIDGLPAVAGNTNFSGPTSDSLLSFDFPSYYVDPCTCPAGTNCECTAVPYKPGQHSISVKNDNGTSNTVTFTLDP
jgi:hypothetical protein